MEIKFLCEVELQKQFVSRNVLESLPLEPSPKHEASPNNNFLRGSS